jgi:heterodisulfide reductase subunit A
VPMTQSCLVIGGGISGCTAASSIAGLGYDVTIVEKTGELGGLSRNLHFGLAGNVALPIHTILDAVENNPKIKVLLNSEVEAVTGNVGQFVTSIKDSDGKIDRAKFGAVIVATGARNYVPKEYSYGKDPRVLTQGELQQIMVDGKWNKPSIVVMIQCVGSRNEEHTYCNRTCCSQAIANALKIKEISPETRIHILNRDIMTYGLSELHYLKTRESGVLFQRYEMGKEPRVTANDKNLAIEWHDPAMPGRIAIEADMLVLSTGVVAEGNEKLAGMLGLELTLDGFFKELDTKFRPVDVIKDGIFITGLANAPRNLKEKITEAQAAAQRAANVLSRIQLVSGRFVSEVDKHRCSCCGLCVEACPFSARSLDLDEHCAVVDEVLCQACGQCVAVCPNDAARMKGQKDKLIMAQIDLGI